MTRPTLSFIVPVYNRAAAVGKCLASVLEAGADEVEIVLVDDASTDATGDVCRDFAARLPRVRYHRNRENRGQGYSRNLGAAMAEGEFLFFLDSDDAISPGELPRLARTARDNPGVDLICMNNVFVTPAGVEKYKNLIREEGCLAADRFLARHPYMTANPLWQFAFRRLFFLSGGEMIPKTYNMEDLAFTTYAFSRAEKVFGLPIPFYKYTAPVREARPETIFRRNLAGFAEYCRIFAGLPEKFWNSRPFLLAARKALVNMILVSNPEDIVAAARSRPVPGAEPALEHHRSGDPMATVALWASHLVEKARVLAERAARPVFLAPAVREHVAFATIAEGLGCRVAGFMDNDPRPENPNAAACMDAGYEVAGFASRRGRANPFPLVFAYDGMVACALRDQLLAMGMKENLDFVSVSGDL